MNFTQQRPYVDTPNEELRTIVKVLGAFDKELTNEELLRLENVYHELQLRSRN